MNNRYKGLFLGSLLSLLEFCSCSLTGEEFCTSGGTDGEEAGNMELTLSLDPTVISADGSSSTRLVVKFGGVEVEDKR